MGAPVGALIGMREQENSGFEGEKAMNIESSRGIHYLSQSRVNKPAWPCGTALHCLASCRRVDELC